MPNNQVRQWLAGEISEPNVSDMTSYVDNKTIRAAAERLLAAESSGSPTDPVRNLIGSNDIEAAYAVQQEVASTKAANGARLIGRKIGLTSAAVQRQVGVDQPDFGVLFDDMSYPSGVEVDTATLIQPRAEAEIAFVLAEDIDDPERAADDFTQYIAYATPAIEIVDSRIRAWDVAITDTIADNASSGIFILGEARRKLGCFVPRDATMEMSINSETVSTGDGRACLGDPLAALRWLADTSVRVGAPLRAGEVVLSGALGPLAVIERGHTVTARISKLGSVTATFK